MKTLKSKQKMAGELREMADDAAALQEDAESPLSNKAGGELGSQMVVQIKGVGFRYPTAATAAAAAPAPAPVAPAARVRGRGRQQRRRGGRRARACARGRRGRCDAALPWRRVALCRVQPPRAPQGHQRQ